MSIQEFKTVEDLARLTDEELVSCLGALRAAIVKAKRRHANSIREGMVAADTPFVFPTFDWRTESVQSPERPLESDTPVDDFPVRPSARQALKELGIFRVEDLSAISERELLRKGAIGLKTVTRLREIAWRIGLDLLPNPNANERLRPRT
jgi:hypothetical protein